MLVAPGPFVFWFGFGKIHCFATICVPAPMFEGARRYVPRTRGLSANQGCAHWDKQGNGGAVAMLLSDMAPFRV